jgi:hypothetical protein
MSDWLCWNRLDAALLRFVAVRRKKNSRFQAGKWRNILADVL